jgi:hypothetical protein
LGGTLLRKFQLPAIAVRLVKRQQALQSKPLRAIDALIQALKGLLPLGGQRPGNTGAK